MRQVYVMRESDSEADRRGSAFIDLSTQPRGIGFALKRSTSSDRETSGNGSHHHDYLEEAAREAIKSSYRSKSVQYRSYKGDITDGSLNRPYKTTPTQSHPELFKIAIAIIAVCFLAVTLMQASVVLVVRHTTFLRIPRDHDSQLSGTSRIMFDVEDMSVCESSVRIAMQNFSESLPQKTVLPQVSSYGRNFRRPPRLALICPDLADASYAVYLSTIGRGLQKLGYDLELYARQDGDLRTVWQDSSVPVHFVEEDWQNISVDWSTFEGVLAVSLESKKIIESLAQKPFTDIPLIWIIQENVVLDQGFAWNASVELETVYKSWLGVFNRSSVVVFPTYFLPCVYNDFYNGRFYVIAGSPSIIWGAEQYMMTHARPELRAKAGLSPDDFVIVVVGRPCTKKEIWREHAIVLKAVANLTSSSSLTTDDILGRVKLFVLGHRNSSSGYEDILQMMAQHVGLDEGLVKHVGVDEDVDGLLWIADAVVYASIWEELSFPPIVIRAMSFERPVLVPNIDAISQQIVDGQLGFVFPAGDEQALGELLLLVRSNVTLAQTVALEGASFARNLRARDVVVEYGNLLEKLLEFPEEVITPHSTAELQDLIPSSWRWDSLDESLAVLDNSKGKDLLYLKSFTDLRFVGNNTWNEDLESDTVDDFDWLSESDWDQEKLSLASETLDQAEDELVKDRLDMVRTTYEEVSKMVKKTETRVSQARHNEIDQLEVERIAQPLSIYEPFDGPGAASFLHRNNLLYHGLSLSAEGRRPQLDDLNGASRLGLLNNSYYRDVLCDFVGFFAVAKLIDLVHKNPWIGFQPWRAVSQGVGLSLLGEAALLDAVSEEKDGDTLYFWAQMESKGTDSVPIDDFWSLCDLANSGNCRRVFLDTFKHMYGLPSSWNQLLPMPSDGGSWSASHCWAMPTTSFLQFVMFARMFVDALDALQFEDHHDRGRCCFSSSRLQVKHCYCNFLEGLINVWAYHSARRMIYIDPESGFMKEQHDLQGRNGTMGVKWFKRSLLRSMDEDLAESADEEEPRRRSLWPETGEVCWAGSKDKERRERYQAKVEKKRRQLERQAGQTKYRQKPIGRRYRLKAA